MVVVDLEIAFGLERERHSAVLREGVVHLRIMGTCVDLSLRVGCLRTYVIEEANPGRDIDGLWRC